MLPGHPWPLSGDSFLAFPGTEPALCPGMESLPVGPGLASVWAALASPLETTGHFILLLGAGCTQDCK